MIANRALYLLAGLFYLKTGVVYGKGLILSGPDDSIARLSGQILKVAYKKIGYDVVLRYLPAERSLQFSNRNKKGISGEINRILSVGDTYENLVPVLVPVNRIEGMAFSHIKSISVSGWESLKPYKIGIRIGTKFAEKNTQGMNVTRSASNQSLFSMLAGDRIQVVITSRTEGLFEIAKNRKLQNVKALEPPLISVPLYHFLHSSKKELVPKITEVLKKMNAEKDVQRIRTRFFSEFGP